MWIQFAKTDALYVAAAKSPERLAELIRKLQRTRVWMKWSVLTIHGVLIVALFAFLAWLLRHYAAVMSGNTPDSVATVLKLLGEASGFLSFAGAVTVTSMLILYQSMEQLDNAVKMLLMMRSFQEQKNVEMKSFLSPDAQQCNRP